MTAAVSAALDLYLAGRRDEAAAAYSAILKDDPDCAEAWHLLGIVAKDKNDEKTATALVGKALELDPNNPIYHHNLAGIQARIGKRDEAIVHYREAVRLQPDCAEAYYNLINTLRVTADDPVVAAIKASVSRADLQ
jgi:Flp pilus assembly protein TadD